MIPVTVLTGYLGSGKTTLLARLLKDPALGRTAVIINEFGAVGIDHDLVEASEESFVELDTGCICCAVRGDLETTLADLVGRRARGLVPAFERVIIETSGLADPAPVLNAVMSEAGRGAGLVLGRVVTTVDAATGLASLDREPQSVRQVAVADRLVLTKVDLVGTPPPDLLERIATLNRRAPLLTAVYGQTAAIDLLDGPSAAAGEMYGGVEAWLGADDPSGSRVPAGSNHRDTLRTGHHARHGDDIQCITLRRDDPLPAVALTLLVEALADHCAVGLLRLKGIVHVAESPERPAVIHGVQHVFHEPSWLERWPSADRSTRLVLIGRGLSRLWLERLLDALATEVAEVAGAC
ncbi:MAG: GTP-binding protein [Hyphomicrobiaceae bacterium]|nr:GTP-binding protein [Hyphomicrobiaceae bacterium]